jgi:HD-like signal output (HDOD) protein
MQEDELRQSICRLEAIASPSASLDRILDLAADCESDIGELTHAIESDPAVTSKVLRLSNSAYFGVAGGVATVGRAILVIGYKNVLSLATCAALAPVFSSADSTVDRVKLWLHCCATAEAARILAEGTRFDPSIAYVGGLLHDLGVVVLAEVLEKEYGAAVLDAQESERSLARSETRLFGVDHAWAAGVLFERWTLPDELSRAVSLHHEPLRDASGFASLIAVASHLASASGLPGPEARPPATPPEPGWLAAAGLTEARLEAASDEFAERRDAIELGAGTLES